MGKHMLKKKRASIMTIFGDGKLSRPMRCCESRAPQPQQPHTLKQRTS